MHYNINCLTEEKKKYFMSKALEHAQKYSEDPNTKVGVIICDKKGFLVSYGYNNMPERSTRPFSWEREGNFLETKYPFVIHAEMRALCKPYIDFKNCILFTTLFPCNECAKLIVQSGISKVYYLSDKYADTDSTKAAKLLFDACEIEYEQITP